MPAPAHVRATFSGVFGPVASPVEIWQFNINFSRTRSVTQVQPDAENVQDLSRAWLTHLAPQYTPDVTLTRVRMANIDATGHVERQESGAYRQEDDNTVRPGTNSSTGVPRLPLFTSLVVSLTSAAPGAVGKGRFFLPWPAASLDSDYRIGSAAASAWAARARDFLEDCTSAVHARPVVASGGSKETGAPPALYPVISVRVGRVPDTMRSRRSHMLEGYSVVSIDTTDNVEK